MKKKQMVVNLVCFVGLFVFSLTSFAQESVEFYKQKTIECLSDHDCNRAQIMYDSYKELSKQKDLAIEAEIEKCISSKMPVDASPKVVETFLEVAASILSFNEMGDDKKSILVTSNAPWSYLRNAEWVKMEMTKDSTAIHISCDPNISRRFRTDSIIIQAGNNEKVIIIEQTPVTDPLLVGEQMLNQGQPELAKQYFQLCIDSENPEEWNKLAKLYVDRGENEYYIKALDLLRKSADSHNESGMCSLGYMYETGLGTPKDVTAAIKLYTLSATLNYAPAQYNLGLIYEYGTGVKQDEKEAVKWYRRAANQGFSQAQKKLDKFK